MDEFTDRQLAAYEAYERVRESGRFNMFDPRARQLTGLEEDEYLFVLSNYTELRTAFNQGANDE